MFSRMTHHQPPDPNPFQRSQRPPGSAWSDRELGQLIARVADAQDVDALRQLYEQVAPKLHGLALRIVREPRWAEDVLQETFLTVWRSAADYQPSLSPPLAWLGLITRSRALDALRRHAQEREHLHPQSLDEWLGEQQLHPVDGQPGPQDVLDASQQARALHRCLGTLEKRQREVLSLAYLRDLSHTDLAAQFGLPLGTVKTWIRRGLDRLRGCLSDVGLA